MIKRTEAEIEKEQVEWVFGLTGGELADQGWDSWTPGREGSEIDARPVLHLSGHAYWYEGVPDYCEQRERVRWEYDTSARTVVVFGGGYLPAPDPWLVDEEGVWVKVACYTSSGEAECPGRHEDEGPKVRREHCHLVESTWRRVGGRVVDVRPYKRAECPYCEERVGSEHGYIYIGEGYEAVYALAVHRCKECGEGVHCRKVEDFADQDCGCLTFCAACLDAAHEDALEDEDIRREEGA